MGTTPRSRAVARAAALAAAAVLSAPLSVAWAGAALAGDSNGKADAPGQLRKAADATPTADSSPTAGPVAPAVVGPVATDATTTQATSVTVLATASASPATTPMSPQPLSNADQNAGGANNGGSCGAYCSTRDGSPSLNGNGSGGNKPCAGCVGKADNKNPPGQAPNGTDHNNGYECDGNSGVGKTNPAHTGCTLPPPPPLCVESPGHSCTPPPPCVVTATHTCTIGGGGGGPGTTPVVGPPTRPRVTPPLTGTPEGPGTGTPTLPFTGSQSALLVQLAMSLILMGAGCTLLGFASPLAAVTSRRRYQPLR
jgi:hypothetical protein